MCLFSDQQTTLPILFTRDTSSDRMSKSPPHKKLKQSTIFEGFKKQASVSQLEASEEAQPATSTSHPIASDKPQGKINILYSGTMLYVLAR